MREREREIASKHWSLQSLTQASLLTLADSIKSKNACGGNGYHNSG